VAIEIILHTPGGLVLAASQIARALRDQDGRVVAVVPRYAMFGGTLIALAADEVVLDRHAALGRRIAAGPRGSAPSPRGSRYTPSGR
jgi:ClpP class serine protease